MEKKTIILINLTLCDIVALMLTAFKVLEACINIQVKLKIVEYAFAALGCRLGWPAGMQSH